MATLRQKKLAVKIIENALTDGGQNAGEMLENVGYKKSVAKHKPKEIIEAKGVQEELKNLGFSVEGAKKVVQEIMYDSEVPAAARLQATRQVFEVTGEFAPEKHLVITKKIISIDE